MRKTSVALIVLAAGALLAGLFRVRAQAPDESPTFYFTRLVYTENSNGRNRGRSRGTMAIPDIPYVCPEFGGGNFFPIQGWGWATDYPGGDCKFMGGVHRLTGIRVHPHPNVVEILSDKLFKFPFVYAVEVGGMYLNPKEAAQLREYLLRGGFLHVDDFWGLYERDNFFLQLQNVFPDRQPQRLPLSHPVFHSFFDIEEILQIPGQGDACRGGETWQSYDDREPAVYGVSDDDGRLMVLVTYNADLGDAWEYMDLPCYPAKYSGQAYRLGINFMIYAMSH